MKKFSKIITILLAITMLLSNARLLRAEDGPTTPPTPGEDSNYEPISGSETYFDKYLITNKGQEIPSVEFKYTIEAGKGSDYSPALTYYAEAQEGDEGAVQADGTDSFLKKDGTPWPNGTWVKEVTEPSKFQVFPGIVDTENNRPSITSAKFGEEDTEKHQKYSKIQEGDTLGQDVLREGTVYSKDKITIDFSGIKFKEPGIYRYIITELKLEDESIESVEYDIEADHSMVRVLDVYVVDGFYYVESTADDATVITLDNQNDLLDKDGKKFDVGTKVKMVETPALRIDNYVLHETKSTVLLTDEMGSKDENAEEVTVESKWIIVDGKYDSVAEFDTKEEAEIELERRRSEEYTTDPNYDNDIKAADDVVKEKTTIKNQKEVAYNTARQNAGIPALEATLQEKKNALTKLQKGVDKAEPVEDLPGKSIVELLAEITDASDTSNDADLRKYGYESLRAELVDQITPKNITVLRRVIDKLLEDIETAKGAVTNAQNNLDNANKTIEDALNEFELAQIELEAANAALEEAKNRHNNAKVFELAKKIWKLTDKSDHYTNEISTFNLEFGKEIEGNQGSRDKYFKFTLTLENLRPATPFYREATTEEIEAGTGIIDIDDSNVDTILKPDGSKFDIGTTVIQDIDLGTVITIHDDSIFLRKPSQTASTKYSSETMGDKTANDVDDDETTLGQQINADENGKIVHVFYLKDGEYITIKDLPNETKYSVIEDEEDYKKTKLESTGKDGTEKIAYEKWVYEDEEYETEENANQVVISNIKPTSTDPIKYVYKSIEYDTFEEAKSVALEDIEHIKKIHDDPTSGTLDAHSGNIYTGYTNTRNGIIPTGVMAAAGTGALIVGAGILGLVAMNRRREEDDEEE